MAGWAQGCCAGGVALPGLTSDYVHVIINNVQIAWAFKFDVFLAICVL